MRTRHTAEYTPPDKNAGALTNASERPLLEIQNLHVQFIIPPNKLLTAVDGVTLSVHSGEIHGIIGESGSGKTVLATSIIGMVEAAGLTRTGSVFWQGRDLSNLSEHEMQLVRGREIAIVFQNAQASLNPALRIGTQLGAVLRKHQGLRGKAAELEALRLLHAVRLPDPSRIMQAYSYECSGGMAQRVVIALALACHPKLLILDEPTTALDALIAVQIMELLDNVRYEFGLTMLLISHDLGIVSRLCSRVSVMYLGKIVETAPTKDLFTKPLHPYTRALLEATELTRPLHQADLGFER